MNLRRAHNELVDNLIWPLALFFSMVINLAFGSFLFHGDNLVLLLFHVDNLSFGSFSFSWFYLCQIILWLMIGVTT